MTIRGPLAIVLIAVLVISLAANFLILGFGAARVADVRQGRIDRIVAIAARGFPPDIRRAIVADAVAQRQDIRAALSDLGKARQTMFAAMRAADFDAAALAAASEAVRQKTAAFQKLVQDIAAEAVAAAPAASRAEIKSPRFPVP